MLTETPTREARTVVRRSVPVVDARVKPRPASRPRRPRGDGLRHVALLIETSGSYGRGLLRGIARYNREHGSWSVFLRPTGLFDPLPVWLRDWDGDGILARQVSPELWKTAEARGIPVVNLRGAIEDAPAPSVTVDNAEIARLAAEHLLERGFRRFAFCGKPAGANAALDQRGEQFAERLRAAGHACEVFQPAPANAKAGWEAEQDRLAAWLRALPKPIGVLACNDERGLQILDACRRAGVLVPDDVAVVGVDNDVPLCELTIPPLTSIDVNSEAVGYEAAAVLDHMMSGGQRPERPLRLPPRGVVVRRSSDTTASDDEDVCRALRFIHDNACRGLQASDVLAHLGMSRAALQARIKQVTGRTIHREIQRVRLNRACELLAGSELTIKQVARESGFASVQYLTRVFRAHLGETPALYRRRRRA